MPEFNSIKNAINVLQNTKWLFRVVALQWTAKKRKKTDFNTRGGSDNDGDDDDDDDDNLKAYNYNLILMWRYQLITNYWKG